MKVLAALCFLLVLTTPLRAYTIDIDVVKEILLGLLEGIAAETHLDDVIPCIKDVSSVGSDLEQAYKDFQIHDATHIAEGLKLVGEALQVLPDAMTECKAAESEIEKVVAMLKTFISPTSFVYHVGKDLIINGVQIFKDIEGAVNAYGAQEWEVFGEDVGNALAAILIGQQQNVNKLGQTANIDINVVKQILLGVLEGVTAETHLDDIVPCIKDVTTVGTELEQAIKDLAVHDATHVAEALKLIGQALQILPDAMTQCGAAVDEVKKLVDMLKTFTSPLSFAYHVGKDILVNGVQIFKDIDGAIKAYEVQEWEVFGYDIGHALAAILIGQEAQKTIYDHFASMDIEEFKAKHLGLRMTKVDEKFERISYAHLLTAEALPESFDSRKQWPNCIHPIRNQEHCGSCWAFAGSEVLSDRFCIASQGQIDVVLSPQYMVACDTEDHGCHGGQLDLEWNFLESKGIVLDTCFPYTSGANGTEPACISKCADGSALKNYKAKTGSTKVFSDVPSIKAEILANGPVETGFMVYKDFPNYPGGIYVKNNDELLGGHAVKIVGWGKENGVEYWICANSWGPTWGEQGFFRIKMGECEVDAQVVAGQADLTTARAFRFLE